MQKRCYFNASICDGGFKFFFCSINLKGDEPKIKLNQLSFAVKMKSICCLNLLCPAFIHGFKFKLILFSRMKEKMCFVFYKFQRPCLFFKSDTVWTKPISFYQLLYYFLEGIWWNNMFDCFRRHLLTFKGSALLSEYQHIIIIYRK